MDIDDPRPPHHPPQHTNAVAGPSSLPDIPPLYLPPPGPPQPPPYFRSTEDLLARFQLLGAYDKYVRPFAPPVAQASATDKGKAKEVLALPPSSPPGPGGAAGDDGDDDEGGKGEKKHKNYKHLIKAVPGKHSMRKDDSLGRLMGEAPKQKMEIKTFSQKTTREAFSVSLEGLKGWNIHALVAESPQAREDRKRRKELKKLKLAKGVQIPSQASAVPGPNTPSGLPQTPTPSGAAPVAAPPRSATPRPGTQKPPPTHSQPRGRTPVGIGTPHSVATPTSGSAPSAPPGPPSVARGQPEVAAPPRGVKREREREDSGLQVNGNIPPQGQGPDGVKSAKAGVAGVRPRPVKKPRLDASGQPYQQPTPHA